MPDREVLPLGTSTLPPLSGLSANAQGFLLQNHDFADLEHAVWMSRQPYTHIGRTTVSPYSIRYYGKSYINYTAVCCEFDRLVNDALGVGTVKEANVVLRACARFDFIKTMLGVEFGYCIQYYSLPDINLTEQISLDTVNAASKISILPYVLDGVDSLHHEDWISLIRGLLELGF